MEVCLGYFEETRLLGYKFVKGMTKVLGHKLTFDDECQLLFTSIKEVTHLNSTYNISVLRKPCIVHLEGALQVLMHIEHALVRGLIYRCHGYLCIEAHFGVRHVGEKGDQKSATRYYIYFRHNLLT